MLYKLVKYYNMYLLLIIEHFFASHQIDFHLLCILLQLVDWQALLQMYKQKKNLLDSAKWTFVEPMCV